MGRGSPWSSGTGGGGRGGVPDGDDCDGGHGGEGDGLAGVGWGRPHLRLMSGVSDVHGAGAGGDGGDYGQSLRTPTR